jgi:hypothetical protein
MYAKDISKKVRTSFKTKQLKGEYLGTIAPFGYMKDADIKGKLAIDPVSSEYVKDIFTMFLGGTPILTITKELTKRKVPTPSSYSGRTYTQKYIAGVWNDKAVRFILKNPVYIGHTVQNKKQKLNYKVKKQVSVPKSEWITVEDTHEAIILKDDFNKVQEVLGKRSYVPKSGTTRLLTGFAFCAKCGAPIAFINQYQKGKYYTICSTAKRNGKLKLCSGTLIKAELVEDYITNTLRTIAADYINQNEIIESANVMGLDKLLSSKKQNRNMLLQKIEKYKKMSMNLYTDKVDGVIEQQAYIELAEQLNIDRTSDEEIINKIDEEILELEHKKSNDSTLKNVLNEFLGFETIERHILALLVEKIVIHPNRSIEIHFTFREPMKKKVT